MTKYMNPEYDYFLNPGPLQSETTHKADFVRHNVQKPDSFKKMFYCPPIDKMESITSYTREYVEKPYVKAKPIKADLGKRVEVKFKGESRYKHDFQQWKIERTEPIPQYTKWEGSLEPFQETSVYLQDFKRHENSRPRTDLRRDRTVAKSNEPLDLRTSHSLDYIKHPMPEKYKIPKEVYIPTDMPLEKYTIHKLDYTPKKAEVRKPFKPDQIRMRF